MRARDAGGAVVAAVRSESFHIVGEPPVSGGAIRISGRCSSGWKPRRHGVQVILGTGVHSDAAWRMVADEPAAIPWGYVERRWPAGRRTPSRSELQAALSADPTSRCRRRGTDVGPWLRTMVCSQARWLERQAGTMETVDGLLAGFRPASIVTGWEASRTAWLGAARRLGVPVVAIQHGVIYPRTPDYVRPADPAHAMADVTCLFGPYERELLIRQGGYAPTATVATGSPRATPATAEMPLSDAERAEIRARLGAPEGHRILVVSTARDTVGDRFPQHGGDRSPARPAVARRARRVQVSSRGRERVALPRPGRGAGSRPRRARTIDGHDRDIDVYRLLRAADAHLGLYSTVLTDAVLTSTPNMVAVGQAWADLIGYVDAGRRRPWPPRRMCPPSWPTLVFPSLRHARPSLRRTRCGAMPSVGSSPSSRTWRRASRRPARRRPRASRGAGVTRTVAIVQARTGSTRLPGKS